MKKIYRILEKTDTIAGRLIDTILLCLIILNIVLVVADSYRTIRTRYSTYFNVFEIFSVVIFTVEYILRLICSPYRYREKYNVFFIIKHAISPIALIDLLAILPFYLPLLLPIDFRLFRVLRMFRLLRVLKINRYSKALDLIVTVFKKKKAELLLSSFILIILIFFAGSLMYYIENEVQPSEFPNIIDSVKWSIRTMVFLGYDTVEPHTPLGGILGMVIVVLGLGWLTLPISILSSGFIEAVSKESTKCPHCGKEI